MTLQSWPGGLPLAVIFNVAYESWSGINVPAMGPMGNPLPAGVADLQARSWGRYGHTAGIQRLQGILDYHGVRATVMVSGVLTEQAPESLAALQNSGHDICAHGYSQNVLPGAMSDDEEPAEIDRCANAIQSVTGVRPRGWMSPRGTPSERTAGYLAEAGFEWHGDCFDSDVPYLEQHPRGDLVAIPFHMEINDLPVSLKHGNSPRILLDSFRDAVQWATTRERGPLHIDVTAHAHFFGRAANAWVYDAIVAEAVANPAIWCGTRSGVSDLVRSA